MIKQFEVFEFLCIFQKKKFPSKAFSMSELTIYQILKFNYYKKIQECRTNDVDGDFISFNLHRNTEKSIILLKRWRGDYKKEYCQI